MALVDPLGLAGCTYTGWLPDGATPCDQPQGCHGDYLLTAACQQPQAPSIYDASLPIVSSGITVGVSLGGNAVGAQAAQQMQQKFGKCLDEFYQSTPGKVTDTLSAGGLLWGPNKLSNLKLWGEALFFKYGGLTAEAAIANKVDTVTLTTLNVQAASGVTTITMGSSAGAGLSTGLKVAGKVSTILMAIATYADIGAHGYCVEQANPGSTMIHYTPGLVAP